jgi:hypothetical protein
VFFVSQFIPARVVLQLKMPGFGQALLMNRSLPEPYGACYSINGDDMTGTIIIGNGWDGFAEDVNIQEGTLVLCRIHATVDSVMVVDFVEISNHWKKKLLMQWSWSGGLS